jgi:hypothetical protein
MATLQQFLARPASLIKRVMVVAGRSAPLRDVAIETIDECLDSATIERIDARTVSIQQLLISLAEPPLFTRKRVVIYGDLKDGMPRLEALTSLVDRPPARTVLVLTAPEIRRSDGQRWIPSDPRVQYVDCSHPSVEQTASLIMRYGLDAQASQYLIERCQGSIYDILRVIDLLHVFKRPWSLELVKSITPASDRMQETFEKYAIMPGTDSSLCRQLRRRLVQIIELSTLTAGQRMGAVELAQRIDAEPFIVAKLLPMARGTTPQQWLPKLEYALTAAEYAAQGMPGVREYLATVIET